MYIYVRFMGICSKAIYKSNHGCKCQIMTIIQSEKMDGDQLVQSLLLLQDEILGKQTELLQQKNMINNRLCDLSK